MKKEFNLGFLSGLIIESKWNILKANKKSQR